MSDLQETDTAEEVTRRIEGEELDKLLSVLGSTKLWKGREVEWNPTSVSLVENPSLKGKFKEKREELLKITETPEFGKSGFGFGVELESHISEICRDGPPRGRVTSSGALGDPTKGFTVFRHIDVLMCHCTQQLYPNEVRVVMYKILPGRMKRMGMQLSLSSKKVEPTPHYECHGPIGDPNPDDLISSSITKSQIYLYDMDSSSVLQHHPRHVMPLAVIKYTRKGSDLSNDVLQIAERDELDLEPGDISISYSKGKLAPDPMKVCCQVPGFLKQLHNDEEVRRKLFGDPKYRVKSMSDRFSSMPNNPVLFSFGNVRMESLDEGDDKSSYEPNKDSDLAIPNIVPSVDASGGYLFKTLFQDFGNNVFEENELNLDDIEFNDLNDDDSDDEAVPSRRPKKESDSSVEKERIVKKEETSISKQKERELQKRRERELAIIRAKKIARLRREKELAIRRRKKEKREEKERHERLWIKFYKKKYKIKECHVPMYDAKVAKKYYKKCKECTAHARGWGCRAKLSTKSKSRSSRAEEPSTSRSSRAEEPSTSRSNRAEEPSTSRSNRAEESSTSSNKPTARRESEKDEKPVQKKSSSSSHSDSNRHKDSSHKSKHSSSKNKYGDKHKEKRRDSEHKSKHSSSSSNKDRREKESSSKSSRSSSKSREVAEEKGDIKPETNGESDEDDMFKGVVVCQEGNSIELVIEDLEVGTITLKQEDLDSINDSPGKGSPLSANDAAMDIDSDDDGFDTKNLIEKAILSLENEPSSRSNSGDSASNDSNSTKQKFVLGPDSFHGQPFVKNKTSPRMIPVLAEDATKSGSFSSLAQDEQDPRVNRYKPAMRQVVCARPGELHLGVLAYSSDSTTATNSTSKKSEEIKDDVSVTSNGSHSRDSFENTKITTKHLDQDSKSRKVVQSGGNKDVNSSSRNRTESHSSGAKNGDLERNTPAYERPTFDDFRGRGFDAFGGSSSGRFFDKLDVFEHRKTPMSNDVWGRKGFDSIASSKDATLHKDSRSNGNRDTSKNDNLYDSENNTENVETFGVTKK